MENAGFAAQKKRVTEQLGEAVFAAVGLMVRQYMGAPTEEDGGQDSAAVAWDDGAVIEGERAVVNESFDPVRYRQLGGAAAEAARESAPRGDGRASAGAAREKASSAGARTAVLRTREREGTDAAAAAAHSAAGRHDAAAWTIREEGDLLPSARAVSDEIERDARRYDGGFYLY